MDMWDRPLDDPSTVNAQTALPTPASPKGAHPNLSAASTSKENLVHSQESDPSNRPADRLLARLGLLDDAPPLFGCASAIPRVGVLLAVPALTLSPPRGEETKWPTMLGESIRSIGPTQGTTARTGVTRPTLLAMLRESTWFKGSMRELLFQGVDATLSALMVLSELTQGSSSSDSEQPLG